MHLGVVTTSSSPNVTFITIDVLYIYQCWEDFKQFETVPTTKLVENLD
jgi:hypothetical protein